MVVALHIHIHHKAIDAEQTPHLVCHQTHMLVASWRVEFQTAFDVVAVFPYTFNSTDDQLHTLHIDFV